MTKIRMHSILGRLFGVGKRQRQTRLREDRFVWQEDDLSLERLVLEQRPCIARSVVLGLQPCSWLTRDDDCSLPKNTARCHHMAEDHTCWACKHLLSKVGALPPVRCQAFLRGIPLEILSGQVGHDHVRPGQRLGFVFELSDGQPLAENTNEN